MSLVKKSLEKLCEIKDTMELVLTALAPQAGENASYIPVVDEAGAIFLQKIDPVTGEVTLLNTDGTPATATPTGALTPYTGVDHEVETTPVHDAVNGNYYSIKVYENGEVVSTIYEDASGNAVVPDAATVGAGHISAELEVQQKMLSKMCQVLDALNNPKCSVAVAATDITGETGTFSLEAPVEEPLTSGECVGFYDEAGAVVGTGKVTDDGTDVPAGTGPAMVEYGVEAVTVPADKIDSIAMVKVIPASLKDSFV